MIIYCDTSALMKKYVAEPGADKVDHWLKQATFIFSSALTEIELTSAIERCKRTGVIDSPTYRTITGELDRDLRHEVISLLAISPNILREAKRLIKQRRLLAPDAIQLATALGASKGTATEFAFLCADRALLDAARLEGLRCRDVSR